MARTHTHRCTVCGADIRCSAPAVDNYDGIPEKYCSAVDPDQEDRFMCEDCYDQGQRLCDSGLSADCRGLATTTLTVDYLSEPLRLCLPCLKWELHEARQTAIKAAQEQSDDGRLQRVR